MVEKLSKEQQNDYSEEADYYEETHSKSSSPAPRKEKRESHEHDWDTERRAHEKHEAKQSRADELREREEMKEDVEYYETYHQAPRKKKEEFTSADILDTGYIDIVPVTKRHQYIEEMDASQGIIPMYAHDERPRHEYAAELDYFEQTHPIQRTGSEMADLEEMFGRVGQPAGKKAKKMPEGMMGYDLELEYFETHHAGKKPVSRLSPLESMGFEMGFIRHGEKGSMKSMPEGMMGYDLEVGYFHNVSQRDNPLVNPRGTEMFAGPIGPQKSRGRRVTDALRGFGEGLLSARDQLYGYRRIPLGPDTNAWRLDAGSVNRSRVGRYDFFHDTRGRGLMSMDPFHLSGHAKAKPGRKKRGRPAGSRSRRSDGGLGGGIPPSLAWMF